MFSSRKRLIPLLLLDGRKRLVKTVGFGERTYIGDPFNIVRLFNEKEVDELCLLDIDATREGRGPDMEFLAELAAECFMPLAYGGGIVSVEQCRALNKAGIEKFVLGAGALDTQLVQDIARTFGGQSVVACIDVKNDNGRIRCAVRSGVELLDIHPLDLALNLQRAGVGEVILQSIDRDGLRAGMDIDLVRVVSGELTIPLIAAGGAGELDHLVEALRAGASAAASGSAFCFIGRLRAVLVSYPEERRFIEAMERS